MKAEEEDYRGRSDASGGKNFPSKIVWESKGKQKTCKALARFFAYLLRKTFSILRTTKGGNKLNGEGNICKRFLLQLQLKGV